MHDPDPKSPQVAKTGVGSTEAELRSRLDALKVDLGDAVTSGKTGQAKSDSAGVSGSAIGTGMRAGSELVAGVIVGCGIGYLLDSQFGTSPLFLIIFMVFGMATGFWNVYRMGARTSAGSSEDGK